VIERYSRRVEAVKAVQLTADVGALYERNGELALNPDAAKLGIRWTDAGGYTCAGERLGFGDYVVLTQGVKRVWAKDDFEAEFHRVGRQA
jgi:hypothetical protein